MRFNHTRKRILMPSRACYPPLIRQAATAIGTPGKPVGTCVSRSHGVPLLVNPPDTPYLPFFNHCSSVLFVVSMS
jgi:hypothetical protein